MMTELADRLYSLMDKGPLRTLSLILALVLAGCIFGIRPALRQNQFAGDLARAAADVGRLQRRGARGWVSSPSFALACVLFTAAGADHTDRRTAVLFLLRFGALAQGDASDVALRKALSGARRQACIKRRLLIGKSVIVHFYYGSSSDP